MSSVVELGLALLPEVAQVCPHLQLHEDGVAGGSPHPHACDAAQRAGASCSGNRKRQQPVKVTSSCMKTGSPAAARARTSAMPLGGSSNTTGPLPSALPSAMATARPARLSPAQRHKTCCVVWQLIGLPNPFPTPCTTVYETELMLLSQHLSSPTSVEHAAAATQVGLAAEKVRCPEKNALHKICL